MNTIIDPMVFYWIELVSKLRTLTFFIVILCLILAIIISFKWLEFLFDGTCDIPDYNGEEAKHSRRRTDFMGSLGIVVLNEEEYVKAKLDNRNTFEKKSKKGLKTSILFIALSVLFAATNALLPSRDTMYKMLVASYMTDENYQFAKDELTELVDYITEKFNGK